VTIARADLRRAGISSFVLQEFRLRSEGGAAEAGRIVAAFASGNQPAIPLLVSIEDPRDVATVRAIATGESAERDPSHRDRLGPLVMSWRPQKQYARRIAERSASPPSSYRLAVTGSGITDGPPDASGTPHDPAAADTTSAVGLLWIGVPLGTHAGLLVLLGGYDEDEAARSGASAWPLPLSRYLGVRIYESQRHSAA